MRSLATICLALALAAGAARAQAPNPVLDGDAFDVLVFDDLFVTTWRYGNRTRLVGLDGTTLQVTTSATTLPLVDVATTSRVVVNDGLPIGAGWPTPQSGSIQAIAMTGLDLPLIGTPGVSVPVSARITPAQGSYTSPVRLQIAIYGGAGGGPMIQVKDNGGVRTPVNLPEVAFTLGVGVHNLEVQVTRGGISTGWVPWNITVDPPADRLQDTDGDGVPDLIEAEAGLDPLVQDAGFDGDGDGWSNFDEVLRGCPAVDATNIIALQYPTCSCVFNGTVIACEPLDTDDDGWSDWDEDMRQTDRLDADYYPAARSLYEPEVTAGIVTLIDELVRASGPGAFEVVDIHGRALPVRSPDGGEMNGAVNVAPSASHLPRTLSADFLVRIPADLPCVLRARSWEELSPGIFGARPFSVKTMLPSLPPFVATDVAARLADASETFVDLADFRAKAALLLRNNLLAMMGERLQPLSTSLVVMLESLAAWELAPDGQRWVSLGISDSPDAAALAPAIDRLAERYAKILEVAWAQPVRPMDALWFLLGNLASWANEPSMANWKTEAIALSTLASGPTSGWPATHASALDLQLGRQFGANVAARTQVRLIGYFGVEFFWLDDEPRIALLDPNGDYDGDGLSQVVELAGPRARATNPMLGDTDGDGDPDATDPCGADPEDACWPGLAALGDGDADGYLDGVDNCPNVWNGVTLIVGGVNDGLADPDLPAQRDTNGDGVGDACQIIATIVSPRSHINITTGTTVGFAFLVNPDILTPEEVTWVWDFDGATADSSEATPSVTFTQPGTYVVTLTSNEQWAGQQVDTRIIKVRGAAPSGPTVAIQAPTGVVEGVPASFGATSNPAGATFAWDFGDGSAAGAGATPLHTFEEDGSYTVTLTGTNANGSGQATTTVVVADTEPVVAGTWGVTGVDYELAFEDESDAHDGIAMVEWEVVAPAGVTLSAGGLATTMVFPFSGIFTVEQRVTDGDGSAVTRLFDVEVEGSDIQLIGATIDGTWKSFTFGHPMIDPVVVAGVPSANDAAPGVVAIRNVTSNGFQARFAEWVYLDGAHGNEQVTFLAMERGTHELADGSVWVADSFELAGPNIEKVLTFTPKLPKRPTVLATAATAIDPSAFMVRVFDPTRSQVTIRLYNEEARAATGHAAETIGWIAIAGPSSSSISVAGSPAMTFAFGARLRHDWRVRHGYSVALAEEKSADSEVLHAFEMADMIAIDDELFGSTTSDEEMDPFTIRRQ